jgi:cell division protein FtsB
MSYWQVIYKSSWVALGVLFAIGIVCVFWPQVQQHREYQRHEAELQAEIELEKEITAHLKRQQERFQNDPRFVEHVAHELGMAKPNETIFKFVPDEPETGESATP